MKLATIRSATGTAAVRLDATAAVETGHRDVGELLIRSDWHDTAAAADGAQHDLEQLDFAPVVPAPSKIVCVGLNYRTHIVEMGRDVPKFPTLFAKYGDALIGAHDDIALPQASAGGRLGSRTGRRNRSAGTPRRPNRSPVRNCGLQRAQRRYCSGLAAPNPAMDAGQKLRSHHPAGALSAHRGRIRHRLGHHRRTGRTTRSCRRPHSPIWSSTPPTWWHTYQRCSRCAPATSSPPAHPEASGTLAIPSGISALASR